MVEKTRLKRKREVRKQRGGYFDKKTDVEKVAKGLVEADELDTYYFNKLKDDGIKHGLEEVELFKNRAKPQEIDESDKSELEEKENELNERLNIEMEAAEKLQKWEKPGEFKVSDSSKESPVFEDKGPPNVDNLDLGTALHKKKWVRPSKRNKGTVAQAIKNRGIKDKSSSHSEQEIDLQRQKIKEIQESVDYQNEILKRMIDEQLGLNKKGSKKYKKKKSKRKSKKSKRKPRKSKRKHKKKSKKTKRK